MGTGAADLLLKYHAGLKLRLVTRPRPSLLLVLGSGRTTELPPSLPHSENSLTTLSIPGRFNVFWGLRDGQLIPVQLVPALRGSTPFQSEAAEPSNIPVRNSEGRLGPSVHISISLVCPTHLMWLLPC
jgi:hypothetical protein